VNTLLEYFLPLGWAELNSHPLSSFLFKNEITETQLSFDRACRLELQNLKLLFSSRIYWILMSGSAKGHRLN
jgi:hypothetical protein